MNPIMALGSKYDGPIPRIMAAFGCWFWASRGE